MLDQIISISCGNYILVILQKMLFFSVVTFIWIQEVLK